MSEELHKQRDELVQIFERARGDIKKAKDRLRLAQDAVVAFDQEHGTLPERISDAAETNAG
jgi:hypothetical protein